MSFPPPGTPVFDLSKYIAYFEQGPLRDLLETHLKYKRLADHARNQLRRGVIQVLRSALREWPAPLDDDTYELLTTRETVIADAFLDLAIASRDLKEHGTPAKLRFIIEPTDGGMIDKPMLDLAERYTQSIPTPDVLAELREAMARLPRSANVWTPDYEVLISYEDELDRDDEVDDDDDNGHGHEGAH